MHDGYSNITNIKNALKITDGITGVNGDPTCVSINLFAGFNTLTQEQAAYVRVIALQ